MVYRATLNLSKLRTHLFRSERVGRSNDALSAWLTERGFWPDGDCWLGEASALDALPAGVVALRGEAVRPTPAQDDPLYGLIFGMADEQWEFYCRDREPDSDALRFVLVEEYGADDGCECKGPVLRAWCREDPGLREITEAERLAHRRATAGRVFYPFALLTFRIHPKGDRVVLGLRHAARAGIGGQYLVSRNDGRLQIVPDPEGGFWRS